MSIISCFNSHYLGIANIELFYQSYKRHNSRGCLYDLRKCILVFMKNVQHIYFFRISGTYWKYYNLFILTCRSKPNTSSRQIIPKSMCWASLLSNLKSFFIQMRGDINSSFIKENIFLLSTLLYRRRYPTFDLPKPNQSLIKLWWFIYLVHRQKQKKYTFSVLMTTFSL